MTLREVLAEGPGDADAAPVELRLYSAGTVLGDLLPVLHLLFFIGVFYVISAVLFTTTLKLLVGAAASLAALNIAVRILANPTSVRVEEDGIALRHAQSETLLRWPVITGIAVRPDVSAMRIESGGATTSFVASGVKPEARRRLIRAMRAHLDREIEEWAGRSYSPLALYRTVSPLAAFGILVAFFALGSGFLGSSLGTRCSGPSRYLQQRFGVEYRRGCSLLGVTGAAERAGLRQGDVLIEVDGIPITSGPQWNDIFYGHSGKHFRMRVVRAGTSEPIDISLTLGPGGGISLSEDDPLFYFRRARADVGEHRGRDIADYSKAIELAPNFELAYLYRGQLHLDADEFDQAAADFERAIALSPDLAEAYRLRGWFRIAVGLNALASSDAQIAADKDNCANGFRDYNVDCRSDYDLLTAAYDATGDARATAARESARAFYPHGD